MSIRKKIFSGFVMIATILLLSSLIAIYEFISMRREVSKVIYENITSINISNMLMEITDEYNFTLFKSMDEPEGAVIPDVNKDTRFTDFFEEASMRYTNVQEKNMADSVRYAYTAYIHLMKNAPYVWQGTSYERREWYFERMYPVYMKLRNYIEQLTVLSQTSLTRNFENLNDSFYRSLMPSVGAVSVGILLIMLFNYFINCYFISPVLKISAGIADYKKFGRKYSVSIDNNDELSTLNNNIRELTDLYSKLKSARQKENNKERNV